MEEVVSLTNYSTNFSKMSKDGSELQRTFLLLKDSETQNTEDILRGLKRLASKGWNVPTDVSEVEISGKEIRRARNV